MPNETHAVSRAGFWIARLQIPRLRNQAMNLRTHRLRGTVGAEIAEAALVMPVVFIFLLGIIWFGRAFNIYSTITQAAQQGAIVAARPVCATCAQPGFPPDTAVVTAVTNVMQASSLDPNQIKSIASVTGCSTPSNIQICRQVVLSNSGPLIPLSFCSAPQQSQVCGATVTFQYPFYFYLPFTSLNLTQVVMNAQAQSRMEN
jgi:Flp pilus assembly protein TadG